MIVIMNYRDYKTFNKDCIYHIYNRGVNKTPIFLDDQDFLVFLDRLKTILGLDEEIKPRSSVRIKTFPLNTFCILSYCLMPNHFHFEIKQNAGVPISQLVSSLCTSYVKYFNKKYGRVGPLFQDTFKAIPVESDQYALYLSAYIHRNPENPLTYPYSSMQEYLDPKVKGICDTSFILNFFDGDRDSYKNYVMDFEAQQLQWLPLLQW